MSENIDRRVVEMQFDNKQFESNVKTTVSALDKLKQSLNLSSAAKGLDDVNSAASKLNMSPLANGISTVTAKFSALQVMGATVLSNITNSAVNAGKKIVSALSLDSIRNGFAEYETQMNSVQTILANTQKEHTNVKMVNSALDELNTYADKTIYNFTEMTRNIGTFTAAGVKLKTSISAIQGIANLAAISGSTSQQASVAMYQLSQALAAGKVQLMDWNSVVNAGMGGQVFQDALIRTSEHLKTGAKEAIKANGSFRESLTKTGWLTTEVLTQTLDQFATAAGTQKEYQAAIKKFVGQGYTKEEAKQMADMARTAGNAATKVKTFTQLLDTLKEALGSGWTLTWRTIIGDFEDARTLWTDVSEYFSDVINKSSDARNSVVEGWTKAGGRDMAIESIKNAFKGLLSILKPIKQAFRDVFPPLTAKKLLKITKSIHELTSQFGITKKQSSQLRSVFKGLFSAIKIGITVIDSIMTVIVKIIKRIMKFSGGLLDATSSLGEWINGISKSITKSNVFGKAIKKITNILDEVISKIKEFIEYVKQKFATPGFDAFFVVAEKIWSYVSKIVKVVGKELSSIIKELGNAFRNGDIKSLVDLINSGIFTTILLALKKWVKGLKTFEGATGGLINSIKDILDTVGDSLKEWQKSIKSNIIKNIAVSIGILAASLWVLSSIDKDKLTSALTAMSACFAELVGSLKILDKLSLDIKNTGEIISLMIGLSVSILMLASALKSISELDLDEIAKGIAGLAGVMTIAIGAMAALSKFASTSSKTFLLTKNGLFSDKNKANFVSMGVALIAIAASMKIFASAAKDFSSLDWNEIAKGMAGIGTVLAEITGFFYLIKKVQPEKIMSTSMSLIAIAASMKIFASAAKDFGNIDWEDLAKAGAAISGILLAVALFSKAMEQSQESMFCLDKNGLFKSGDKSLTSVGVALIAIAASMKIFASAAKDFSSLDWKGIAKAGTAIAGILLSIAGFMHIIPDNAEMFKAGAGLIVIAASMKIFASAAKDFADMDWSDLAKAGVAMGGLLLMIGTFAKVLGSSKSTFKDDKNGIFSSNTKNSLLEMAAALLIISVSMKVFASAMHSLEKLSWEGIAKGLITIGVAMGLLILAAKEVTTGGLIPGLLSIGAAIALIGVGCVAAAAGITALAGMTTAVAAGIVATLRILIIGILKIIPDIVDVLTDIVVALCDVIIRSVPAICKAVKITIIEIAKVITECTPVVADCIMKFISDILVAIVKYTPSIIDSILQFVVAIIEGIAKYLPSIIQSVVDVIMALFSGIIDALNSIDPEILVKGILGIGFMSAMMVALAGMAALTGPAMVGVLGFGAVITELSVVLAAIGGLAQIPGLEWLVTEGGNLLQKVGTAIGQFIGGIAGGIAKGLSSSLPDIGTNLSNFMANLKPFIEGAKQIQPSMLDGVKTLIAVIVAINAANIIDKITSIITGRSSIVQFANSLTDLGKGLASFSNEVKNIDISAVNSAAEAAKALAKMNDYIPNQGGLVSWIVGDNTFSDFAEGLKPLGTGLKEFSNEVSDIDPKSMNAAAEACKSLAKMNDYIPNQGGLVSWIVGDNTFSDFAEGLKPLGEGLSNFSDEVSDIKPKNISRAAEAAKALAEMADTIPNEGGMVAWFSGDNSVASFAEDLMPLGEGLSDFSNEVESIKPKAMNAAAEAAKALAEMADTIPNEGGVVSWFAGDNSIANFASNLTPLGEGLSDFSDEVRTIKPKNVEAAAKAGKALAEMADTIPNEGGVVSWFTGDNSISKFGKDLISLGNGLAGFSYEVEDIEPENIQAAANAAKALAEMVKELPKKGFWSRLFSSDTDVEGFGEDLSVLGSAMSRFDESVSGIDANNIESAAKAAKSIADIKNKLSSDDDDNSDLSVLTEFANNLAPFGKAIYSFSYEVDGINVKKVKAAADAAVSLSSVLNNMPKISDEDDEKNTLNSLKKFINNLEPMGQGINDFNSDVEDINVGKVKVAAEASLSLSKILNNLPKTKVKDKEANTLNSLTKFIKNLKPLGEGINDFNNKVEDIKTQKLEAAANIALTLSKIFNNLPKTEGENEEKEKSTLNSLTTFINKLQPLGQGISDFNAKVKDINVKKVKAASEAAIKIADIITKMPKTSDSQGEKSTLNSLTTFINKLQPLGVGIYDFNTEVKKIDDKKVTSAANAAVKIAGIISKMPTNKVDDKNQQLPNLTKFTNKLQPLGTAIGEFNSGVSDINAKKVTAATDVAIKLADIISKMPETNTDTRHYGYVNIQLQNLSSFTNKLQPLGEAIGDFNSGVSDINSKKVETAANVASTLTTLISEMPTAENDDKSYQLESLSSYTEKLQPLGEAIGEFNKGVSDIDGSRVETAAKVASTLAGLIKEIPDDGRRSGVYSDRKLDGLSAFVDKLTPLGTGIKNFNDSVGNINKKNVTTATNIAISLSDLIGQMPENYSSDDDNKKTGQLAALTDFISELEPLGEAIQKFNKKVGEIATDKVETAANAALTLSEIIPNVRSFSLPSDFTTFTNAGKSTPFECLTAFIKSLEPLGIAINTFNTNVKSINGKVSMDAAKVAVQLSTVINELPDSIKSSATELEEPFKKIGSAVKNFYDQSKNVKPTIVKNVASATKDLGQAVKDLPDGKKVSSFSDNISSLGTNMESFATTVMGIKTDELNDILNSFKTSVNSIVKAAKDGSSELSKAFDSKNSKDDLKSALNNLLKAGIDKISKYNSEFEKAGAALTSNLEKGMTSDSKKNSLSKNIKSVVGHALSAITTRYNSFKSAGSYLIEGLAVGLNDTNSSVYNAAYKLGEGAAKGVKNGGKIKSPSKLTIESGHYLGKGLIVGMDQISNSVYKKGENLGHKAAMSITSAVANVVDTMNMDMDYQPTIRPVVDLSDVSSGVNSMNKMFGINPSIGVISNIRSISSSMNSNQNGNNMLLSAIDKLNDKMKSGDNVNVTVNVDYTSGENADEIANDIAASLQRAIRRGV